MTAALQHEEDSRKVARALSASLDRSIVRSALRLLHGELTGTNRRSDNHSGSSVTRASDAGAAEPTGPGGRGMRSGGVKRPVKGSALSIAAAVADHPFMDPRKMVLERSRDPDTPLAQKAAADIRLMVVAMLGSLGNLRLDRELSDAQRQRVSCWPNLSETDRDFIKGALDYTDHCVHMGGLQEGEGSDRVWRHHRVWRERR